jgi:serine/threonine-protein kinase
MIRLRTLGTIDLRNDEGSELRGVLAQPRRLALLAYLAVASPHGFHRRDRLLAIFWRDTDQDRARASLNRAIYFLRRELGDRILLSRGDEEIGLDAARFACDAMAFDEALEKKVWREALELYRVPWSSTPTSISRACATTRRSRSLPHRRVDPTHRRAAP